MMKKTIFLIFALALVVLVSGCVQFPLAQKSEMGFGSSTISTADVSLDISANPTEVKSGRYVYLYFILKNNQEYFKLDNDSINIKIYDMCGDLFEFDKCNGPIKTEDGMNINLLRNVQANDTLEWECRYKLKDVDFKRDCEIKYKIEYNGSLDYSEPVVVLQEDEYYVREQKGTLDEVLTGNKFSTENPIEITTSWSENQPFLDGEKYYYYIQFENVGPGFIDSLEKNSVELKIPSNLEGSCTGFGETEITKLFTKDDSILQRSYTTKDKLDNLAVSICKQEGFDGYIEYRDYKGVGTGDDYFFSSLKCFKKTGVRLLKSLPFINNKAPKTTCTFTAKANQPIDTRQLSIHADYSYRVDGSLSISVRP